jgi:hypothetical protein
MLHEFHPFEDFAHVISFIKLKKNSSKCEFHPYPSIIDIIQFKINGDALFNHPTLIYNRICSLGQLHRANLLFPLYVFCAFHNCWGNSIWDKGITTKHVWEPKTKMGVYMEEKYEDFQFIS